MGRGEQDEEIESASQENGAESDDDEVNPEAGPSEQRENTTTLVNSPGRPSTKRKRTKKGRQEGLRESSVRDPGREQAERQRSYDQN